MRLKEFEDRFSSLCQAVLITDPKNIYYFTGYFPHSAAYLLVIEGQYLKLIVPELEYEDATHNKGNIEVLNLKNEPTFEFLSKTIMQIDGIKTLGFENEFMTVSSYMNISKKLDSIDFENISDILFEIREIKTQEEINYLRKSAEIADIGIKTAVETINEERTENEVAGEVEYAMRKAGSQKVPFDTIIASGPNGALPHATTTERKIRKGDLIIIDLGATYKGYCSDTSRTICFGKPGSKQQEIYELVLNAHHEAVNFAKAGANVKEVDGIARKMIEGAGYPFIHSLGHGVGLDVHERPMLSFKNENKLVENSVITIEPGIYIYEFGGVRIEDMYIVLKDGLKNLTRSEQVIYL
ncbi:MAG: M24 family metallopeptidase [Candidatus Helarchaeota archaeon]